MQNEIEKSDNHYIVKLHTPRLHLIFYLPMKQYFAIVISLLIFSCNTGYNSEKNKHNLDSEEVQFVGERIDGPANIRDSINGNLVFELFNDVQVEATDFKNKWCQVGLFVKLSDTEFEYGKIEEGTQLLNSKGEIIGKTLANIDCWTNLSDENGNYGYIGGHTHQRNIQNESLIENDLLKFLKNNGRNQNDFESFIKKHGLEKDNRFLNFKGFYIYENWITDPSPGFRICLLFHDQKLQGVLHTRRLIIPNTISHNIARGYKVEFFDDYAKPKQVAYVNYMTEWLNGVD